MAGGRSRVGEFFRDAAAKGRRRSGQAALEYFIMLSVALMVAAPLIIQAQNSLIQVQTSSRAAKVSNAVDSIDEAARMVWNQGEPAQATFTITLPSRINRSEVGPNYIYYQLRTPAGTTDYYEVFAFNVTGSLPSSRGRHVMQVVAHEAYVNITTAE